MNNSQFRNLLQNDKSATTVKTSSLSKPTMLGSRSRPSLPMTPRSVTGHNSSRDFARQVAEQTRQADGQPTLKKFKSTSAPRGTKLAQGYEDRTSGRQQNEEELSQKEKKLKELDEMVKNEKIDRATYYKLRDQMGVGGDLGSTHLVKGLDKKLLERIRRGEDLNVAPPKEDERQDEHVDIDEELDTALSKEVAARPKEQSQPKQEVASMSPQSMTRDEILQRLKQSRNAKAPPAAVPEPVLGDRFKKLPSAEKPGKKKFVEIVNGRRREVLIITDKQGNTKRKTRWLDPEDPNVESHSAPLGMEVPAEVIAKQKALLQLQAAEEEDDDIFQGVGADYDPLKDISSDSEGDQDAPAETTEVDVDKIDFQRKPRNYFGGPSVSETDDKKGNPLTSDPTILAALKRAAAMRQGEEQGEDVDADQAEKQKQFLANLKRREREDAEDLDLGFGESRFGDDDDEEALMWEGEEEPGGKKRKRGGKKRKGNKDNVADVMSVLDRQKQS